MLLIIIGVICTGIACYVTAGWVMLASFALMVISSMLIATLRREKTAVGDSWASPAIGWISAGLVLVLGIAGLSVSIAPFLCEAIISSGHAVESEAGIVAALVGLYFANLPRYL